MYHRSLGDRVADARDRMPDAASRRSRSTTTRRGDCAHGTRSSSRAHAPAPRSSARATTSCSGTRAAPPASPRACSGTRARCSGTACIAAYALQGETSRPTRSTSSSTTCAAGSVGGRPLVSLLTTPLVHATAVHQANTAFAVGGTHRAPRTRPHRRRRPSARPSSASGRACSRSSATWSCGASPARSTTPTRSGEPYDLSSLQRIHNSGAMVSAPLKDALLSRGTMHVYDSLGFERGRRLRRRAHHRRRARARRHASRSARTPRLLADGDRDVAPGSGEVGVLAVAHLVRDRLLQGPGRAARPRSATSTARTYAMPGDQATLDVDGTLTLLGRGSSCINSGGEKVWPEEVEEVLKEHPGVDDAVVWACPTTEWGELVAAVVATAATSPPDAAALDEWVGARLAGVQAPAPHRVRRRGRPHDRGQARLRVGGRGAGGELRRAHHAALTTRGARGRGRPARAGVLLQEEVGALHRDGARRPPARPAPRTSRPGRSVRSAATTVTSAAQRREVSNAAGAPSGRVPHSKNHASTSGGTRARPGRRAGRGTPTARSRRAPPAPSRRAADGSPYDSRTVARSGHTARRRRAIADMWFSPSVARQAPDRRHGDGLAQQRACGPSPGRSRSTQDPRARRRATARAAPPRRGRASSSTGDDVARGGHERAVLEGRRRVAGAVPADVDPDRAVLARAGSGRAGRTPRRRSRWGAGAPAADRRHPSRARRWSEPSCSTDHHCGSSGVAAIRRTLPGPRGAPTGRTHSRFRYPAAHADRSGNPIALRAVRNRDHRGQGHRRRGVVLRAADGYPRRGDEMANQMGKRYTCTRVRGHGARHQGRRRRAELPRHGDGDRPGQAAPLLRLTQPAAPAPATPRARGPP